MRFLFSKRELARQAAIAAHERWHRGEAVVTPPGCSGPVQLEYWGYVVNAALEALPGDDDLSTDGGLNDRAQ